MKKTSEINIRDPFVLPWDGKYYLYGTRGETCWGLADGDQNRPLRKENPHMEPIQIRVASPQDAQAMLAIYAPYVERTAVSFELIPPSQKEFRGRVETTLRRFPWLAVQQGDRVVGYAYASPLHPRAAYAWSAEASIYLAPDCHGQGVGRRLYDELEKILAAQRVQNLNACIACPRGEDDPHLTRASLLFHEKLGFRTWGHAERCAFKFDRWYDMVWMGKDIGTPLTPPAPFLSFPEIREKFTLS